MPLPAAAKKRPFSGGNNFKYKVWWLPLPGIFSLWGTCIFITKLCKGACKTNCVSGSSYNPPPIPVEQADTLCFFRFPAKELSLLSLLLFELHVRMFPEEIKSVRACVQGDMCVAERSLSLSLFPRHLHSTSVYPSLYTRVRLLSFLWVSQCLFFLFLLLQSA